MLSLFILYFNKRLFTMQIRGEQALSFHWTNRSDVLDSNEVPCASFCDIFMKVNYIFVPNEWLNHNREKRPGQSEGQKTRITQERSFGSHFRFGSSGVFFFAKNKTGTTGTVLVFNLLKVIKLL